MILRFCRRLRDWKAKRARAVKLGDMGHALLWCDPETEEIWQAGSRYSTLSTPSTTDGVEGAIRMLDVVPACTLEVPADWRPEDEEVR